MAALEAGIQGLRINPGNIKYQDKVRLIAREAKARGVPIRIGVNAGLARAGPARRSTARRRPRRSSRARCNEARILEDEDFFDIKISVKHSNPLVMIESYRQLAEACDYPLHLGVTEAGPMPMGGVKSAVGIGALLAEGIGDTIRVSLTDDPVEEVKAATIDPAVARPAQARARPRRVPVVRPRRGERARADAEGERRDREREVHGADAGRGDGLRRERPRRGAGGRRRHRERQRARVHHPPGRGRREGARSASSSTRCSPRRARSRPRRSQPARPTS